MPRSSPSEEVSVKACDHSCAFEHLYSANRYSTLLDAAYHQKSNELHPGSNHETQTSEHIAQHTSCKPHHNPTTLAGPTILPIACVAASVLGFVHGSAAALNRTIFRNEQDIKYFQNVDESLDM